MRTQEPTATDAHIRPVRPTDRAALAAFYAGLSPQSRYARFLGFTRGLSTEQARSMCSLDHVSDEGFVATTLSRGHQSIIGHLCLDQVSPGSYELGVAVSDEIQGRGVGRRLFEAALRWARDRGCDRLVATAFADNARVLRLLSSSPLPAQITAVPGGVVEVVIPISPAPVCDYPGSWSQRDSGPSLPR